MEKRLCFGSSNGELEEYQGFPGPGLCGKCAINTFHLKGPQSTCSQRGATVSVEGGREDSPSGWGARAFFVGHGTRNPESRGGKAGRERIGGKLGEGWGEEA